MLCEHLVGSGMAPYAGDNTVSQVAAAGPREGLALALRELSIQWERQKLMESDGNNKCQVIFGVLLKR